MTSRRVIANAEIVEVEMAVPPGHHHLRTVIRLATGEELVLQEATVAALVRAFTAIKTHPSKRGVRLVGKEFPPEDGLKEDFASWQLLEENEKTES